MKVIIDVEDMRLNHEPLDKGAEVDVPGSVAEVWIKTKRAHKAGAAASKDDSGSGGKSGKSGGKKGPQKTADKKPSGQREGSSSENTAQNTTDGDGAAGNTAPEENK